MEALVRLRGVQAAHAERAGLYEFGCLRSKARRSRLARLGEGLALPVQEPVRWQRRTTAVLRARIERFGEFLPLLRSPFFLSGSLFGGYRVIWYTDQWAK